MTCYCNLWDLCHINGCRILPHHVQAQMHKWMDVQSWHWSDQISLITFEPRNAKGLRVKRRGHRRCQLGQGVTTPVGKATEEDGFGLKIVVFNMRLGFKFIIHTIPETRGSLVLNLIKDLEWFLGHSQISAIWCSSAATQTPLVQFPWWFELVWVLLFHYDW